VKPTRPFADPLLEAAERALGSTHRFGTEPVPLEAAVGRILAGDGTRLRTADLASLAGRGITSVAVSKKPRVALWDIGNPVVWYALIAELTDIGAAPLTGLPADAAIAAGSQISVACVEGAPHFVLPVEPRACRLAFEIVVRPALLRMMGAREIARPRAPAWLALDVRRLPGHAQIVWVRLRYGDCGLVATPIEDRSDPAPWEADGADGLIVLGPHAPELKAGTLIETRLLGNRELRSEMRGPRAALAVVGARNAGKTTLVERLIAAFTKRGHRTGFLKHHGHMQALDDPAKDTGRAAAAGAAVTVLAGESGAIRRLFASADPALCELFQSMSGVDLVLVEGYAASALPKVLVVRDGVTTDREPCEPPIVAVVGDTAGVSAQNYGWDAIDRLADDLCARFLDPARPAAINLRSEDMM
jgi:molybdopterin-guanine dinucleotide biosynthesis protein B